MCNADHRIKRIFERFTLIPCSRKQTKYVMLGMGSRLVFTLKDGQKTVMLGMYLVELGDENNLIDHNRESIIYQKCQFWTKSKTFGT